MIKQKIVDQQGHLSPEYKLFNYPECPVYEAPVRKLIETTFAAEKVRRRWLNEKDADRFYAIRELPIKSGQDLLWDDLLATHVISGTLVTDVDEKKFKFAARKVISEMINGHCVSWIRSPFLMAIYYKEKKELADRLLSYLKSCRALYATMETPDAWLRPLQDEGNGDDIALHLNHHLMGLVGFNHVIVLEEKKWSDKMIYRAVAVMLIGAAQLAVAVLLLNFQVSPQIAMALIRTGLGDVLFSMRALLTGQNFTWADYGQYKRKQVLKLSAKICVGFADDGIIMQGDVPLEEILETVAKDIQREATRATTDNRNNEIDAACLSRQQVLRILQPEREQSKTSQTLPDRIQSCLKLMKKTKDPKLFTVFVRNKVPIDQFCADALGCVLSAHLGTQLLIQIENSEQVFDHEKIEDMLTIKIEHGGAAIERCLLQEFVEKFNETGHRDNTVSQDLERLRNSLVEKIEADPSVTKDIRKVWQSRNLQINLFGSHVASKKGIQKADFAFAGIVTDRLSKRDPFQNDYTFIHSAIENENKRKILCNKYPVLTVTYPEVDDVVTSKEEDFKLFRHIQRGHLERGQYRNAVWNTVETNWMPVAKLNETDEDLRKEHVASIKNHFKQYSKDPKDKLKKEKRHVKLIGGVSELENILDNKIARLSENVVQGSSSDILS